MALKKKTLAIRTSVINAVFCSLVFFETLVNETEEVC